MKTRKNILISIGVLIIIGLAFLNFWPRDILSSDAKNYIGQTKTVFGGVNHIRTQDGFSVAHTDFPAVTYLEMDGRFTVATEERSDSFHPGIEIEATGYISSVTNEYGVIYPTMIHPEKIKIINSTQITQ
ncbi:MAG TPA: hypothetical protein VGH42_13630 [Verrucomicrobiae bacterium]|jgi:hypothetical protein